MPAPETYRFETAPDLPGADRVAKYVFGAVRHLTARLWDFTIEGRDNIPTTGPAIIAPNHLSFCDSIFVPAALPRRVWAIGKGEYMDSWKTKHVFPALGMVPIDRSGGDAAQAALDTAASVLDRGHLFMIYPEGTRSRSGNLHKGRTGAARLALRCDAPIVPVGHEGTVAVQPPDSVVLRPRLSVTVRFGAPMWVGDFGDVSDPRTLRRYTDAVMYEIAQLSGQDYVDVYAGKDAPVTTPSRTDEPAITPRRPSVVGAFPSSLSPSHRPMPIGRPAGRADSANGDVDESVDTSMPPSMPSRRREPIGSR